MTAIQTISLTAGPINVVAQDGRDYCGLFTPEGDGLKTLFVGSLAPDIALQRAADRDGLRLSMLQHARSAGVAKR